MSCIEKIGYGGKVCGMPAVTSEQMKEIERRADEAGLSYYQMMENAGSGAAEYIAGQQESSGKKVLIFCGKGNNGGDGFVVARKLSEKGALVQIVLLEGDPKTPDAIKNCNICREMGIAIQEFEEGAAAALIKEADLIIDAVYGTGFHGQLRESVRKAARMINAAKAVTYALDIPSGLNGDSCEADPDTVLADETIVFHRLKLAHPEENCAEFCGRIVCISIGIETVLGD